jgi:hypothetical protein
MKVTRVQTIEKTVTEDVSPEEIVDEIIDAIDFSQYCGVEDTDEFYKQMFEDGLEIVFNSEELELSDEDLSILKPLVIEKLKKIRKIKIDDELKTFLASPYYIAQLMESLNEDLQGDFCFINSDTHEVREAIIKYLQKK